MTKFPAFVRSLVARHVTSATRPSWSPTRIHCPTWNGRSLWMASPAKALPSVSCSAKPITTALTAEVVTSCWLRNVDASSTSAMTMASWRIVGNRSGTRSARSGLISRETAALMNAAAIASLPKADSCVEVSGENG